jgi:hypothetical protein
MIQNRQYVKYTFNLKPEIVGKKDLKTIIELLGVEVKSSKIEQDDDYFIIEIISLYAWKLLIFDRLFNEGAEKISIERLTV